MHIFFFTVWIHVDTYSLCIPCKLKGFSHQWKKGTCVSLSALGLRKPTFLSEIHVYWSLGENECIDCDKKKLLVWEILNRKL
jgi:hypothetical protein